MSARRLTSATGWMGAPGRRLAPTARISRARCHAWLERQDGQGFNAQTSAQHIREPVVFLGGSFEVIQTMDHHLDLVLVALEHLQRMLDDLRREGVAQVLEPDGEMIAREVVRRIFLEAQVLTATDSAYSPSKFRSFAMGWSTCSRFSTSHTNAESKLLRAFLVLTFLSGNALCLASA